jgi:hypothetical protein
VLLPRILLFCTVIVWGWTFVATKILVDEIGQSRSLLFV